MGYISNKTMSYTKLVHNVYIELTQFGLSAFDFDGNSGIMSISGEMWVENKSTKNQLRRDNRMNKRLKIKIQKSDINKINYKSNGLVAHFSTDLSTYYLSKGHFDFYISNTSHTPSRLIKNPIKAFSISNVKDFYGVFHLPKNSSGKSFNIFNLNMKGAILWVYRNKY